MTAIDTWIANVQQNRSTIYNQPIIGTVDNCVAAWQLVAAQIAGGPYLPLAGGTMTGPINLPNGSTGAPVLAWNTGLTGLWWQSDQIGFSMNGVTAVTIDEQGITQTFFSGTNSEILNESENLSMVSNYVANNNANTAAAFQSLRSRGTIAVPLVPQTNDVLGTQLFQPWTGANFNNAACIRTLITETSAVDPTHLGSQYRWDVCPNGSGTLAETMRLDQTNGLQIGGANIVIDINRLHRLRIFTVATLPTAVEGALAGISDATLTMITGLGLAPVGGGANHVPVYADNAGWKII